MVLNCGSKIGKTIYWVWSFTLLVAANSFENMNLNKKTYLKLIFLSRFFYAHRFIMVDCSANRADVDYIDLIEYEVDL